MQVGGKPVPFLSAWQLCEKNVHAGFIGRCSVSYTCSVLSRDMQTLKFYRKFAKKKIIKFSKHAFREGFAAFVSNKCSTCFSFPSGQTASVHTFHMPKPVKKFVFKVLRNALLRYILFIFWNKALKHWPKLQLGVKNRTAFHSAGMFMLMVIRLQS